MKCEKSELGIRLPRMLLKYVGLCQRYGYKNELGSIWLPYDCFPLSRRNCSNHQWKLSDTEGAVVKYRRGRGNIPNSSPPLILQILQINIWVSQAERRFHLGTAKIVTRGYDGRGCGGMFYSSSLFLCLALTCNYRGGNANQCCFSEWKNSSWHNRANIF